MPLSDISVWKERWETLEQVLDGMSKKYANAAQADPRMETIHSLVACLKAFGESQFDFFYNGFSQEKLLPSMYYPKEYILRGTVDQIAYDTAVFQAAAEQRMDEAYRKNLEKTDNLAQLALDVAVQSNLLREKCTVITYFNKSPNIRVIPYAPVALVGLPLSAMTLPRDLLAIPHEIGHYVYHHAPGLAAALHTLIPIDPPYANNWLEEIFSDVYGCLVAGPVIGLGFQDLVFDNDYENFIEDEGHHPVDAIRPYGYSHALTKLGYKKAAPKLDENWNELLQKRHNPTHFVPAGSCTEASLDEAKQAVTQTVTSLVNYLTREKITQPKPWSHDTNNLNTLFPSFEAWANKPSQAKIRLLKDFGDEVGLVEKLADGLDKAKSVRRKGATNTYRDWFKVEANAKSGKIPWPAWFPIFTSGFWPVKGPETNGDSGFP